MKQVLFVVNPIAGGQEKDGFLLHLPYYAQKYQFTYEVYLTTGDNNADAGRIRERIAIFRPSVAVAVGGDGTLLLLASATIHSLLPVGLVPYGSANGMAKELQIPIDTAEAMHLIFRTGKPISVDNLLVNEQFNCLHIGDIGLNAALIDRFQKGGVRGLRGYVLHFWKEWRTSKKHKFIIRTEQERIKTKAHMIAFANARLYGTGALLNPYGDLSDGRFELCIIKSVSLRAFLWAIVASLFSSDSFYRTDYAKIISCTEASIMLKKKDKRLPVQADGEMVGQLNSVYVRAEKGAFRLMVPESY